MCKSLNYRAFVVRLVTPTSSSMCLELISAQFCSRLVLCFSLYSTLFYSDVFSCFVFPPVSEWGDIIDEMSDRMANQPSLIRKFAKER